MRHKQPSKNTNLIFSRKDLQLQAKFQKLLKNLNYYDIDRISLEIIKYIKENDKSSEVIEKRLKTNEPWEYIRGWCEFHNLKFNVNQNVLIPRVETEQLVTIVHQEIKKYYRKKNSESKITILDIGTGSGCIIITLEKLFNSNSNPINSIKTDNLNATLKKQHKINFIGTDISKKALSVAQMNKQDLNSKVKLLKSNLLKDIPPTLLKKSDLFIIANLPYIPDSIYRKIDPSVKDWEPKLALHGGDSGIEVFNKLKTQVEHLKLNPAKIFLEIDPSIKSKIKDIFPQGTFIKDYGKRDRFYITSMNN